MGRIVTIDPVSRIEGHLKIDIEVSGNNIKKAWASGTMFRGIEQILLGRDPREAWIFVQRFCGVCTTVHAIASVRAVENALQLEIPLNAQLIRNLLVASHCMFDHISHFYHLSAFDWVDVVSASKADAAAAANIAARISPWKRNTAGEFQAIKDKIGSILKSGQLGIFNNGYWGHEAMQLSPELNLMAVAHYLQALECQRKINDCVALLGGKTPHIQNLAVGGVANAIDLDEETALNMTALLQIRDYLKEAREFINQVYLPDVCAIATQYMTWFQHGKGIENYLAVPEFPTDTQYTQFEMRGGTVIDGQTKEIKSFADPYFENGVTESVARSWYKGERAKHPYDEKTKPLFTGFDRDKKYSWVKTPLFEGKMMEVGPLAQVLSSYNLGDKRTRKHIELVTGTINSIGRETGVRSATRLGEKDLVRALPSTLGRHAARAIRCSVIAETALSHWERLVDNITKGDLSICNPPEFPKGEISGVGIHEAPRGALSHWVVIKDGKLINYQGVVPSTWNFCPQDEKGNPGPCETSLMGNPIADASRPLEALRTVHSFDPCLACAIHAFTPEGEKRGTAQTRI